MSSGLPKTQAARYRLESRSPVSPSRQIKIFGSRRMFESAIELGLEP
ncbi:hypothetical protein QUB68_04620 [Microcoleus sp. A006_D1]